MGRILTEAEIQAIDIRDVYPEQGQPFRFMDYLLAVAQKSQTRTLEKVAEWLENNCEVRAVVTPDSIELPFLSRVDYEKLFLALKKGEIPADKRQLEEAPYSELDE